MGGRTPRACSSGSPTSYTQQKGETHLELGQSPHSFCFSSFCVCLFACLFTFVLDKVSLCDSSCPGTHCVGQTSLELTEIPSAGIRGVCHHTRTAYSLSGLSVLFLCSDMGEELFLFLSKDRQKPTGAGRPASETFHAGTYLNCSELVLNASVCTENSIPARHGGAHL